jgi:hypothetical protein
MTLSADGREPTELVQLWQQPDGLWRWRWLAPSDEEAEPLVSNEAFEELSEAEESARTAYPGIGMVLPEKVVQRRRGKKLLVLGVVGAAAVVVARRRRDSR